MSKEIVVQKHPHRPIALRFEDVAFSYGTIPVLEDVTFHIHEGEFIALVGPNGAGKTTVLKLILGLERPTRGTIALFDGTPGTAQDRIGYVPQHVLFDPTFPISVEEVVRMGRLRPLSRRYSEDDNRAVALAMEQTDITDLNTRPYAALSGGQRRRVLVARALAAQMMTNGPSFLILDEPTANMDAESEMRLFKTLGSLKGKTTILIVTHDTGFVSSLTDRVLCIGDRSASGRAHTIVRHLAEPAENAPPELFGGQAYKVLHDVELPESRCCEDKEHL
ncbi:MAG TPA: ABC transporter ATP-binding protein [Spirochaetia bacterium]|jgi:zinc transport system ATP-binding protein|nr:ABC transporter ATP-binding protein [Spirochaetia bacterium]